MSTSCRRLARLTTAGTCLLAVLLLTVEAGRDRDDFDAFAARARDRGWPVVRMQGDHNPHWFQPEAFVEVLAGVISAQSD